MQRHRYNIHRVDVMARTTRSVGLQNTYTEVPDPINPYDIINLKSERQLFSSNVSSTGPSSVTYMDIMLNILGSGITRSWAASQVTIQSLWFYTTTADGSFGYFEKSSGSAKWRIQTRPGAMYIKVDNTVIPAGQEAHFEYNSYGNNTTTCHIVTDLMLGPTPG